jgi:membrane associated rhomboid family serine protease
VGTGLDHTTRVTYLLPLVVLAGVALYLLTPDERRRLLLAAQALAARVLRDALRGAAEDEPFRTALRARTRWAVVVPALILVSAVSFVRAAWAPGPLGESSALVEWGANYAPVTTNGQWWRLLTSLFLHTGPLQLLATLVGLVPLALILERWVGSAAFLAVYLAAGIMAGLVGLSTSPVAVAAGAGGAVLGVYGLLAATLLWALVRRPAFHLPLQTMKVVAVNAGLFLLYTIVSGSMTLEAALAGFGTGFAGGMALARGVSESKPPARRVAATAVATIVIAIVSAIPLRGLINVLPELDRAAAFETRTAAAYAEAIVEFRKGWKSSNELVAIIDGTILPELTAARARLRALGKVPDEHRPMVEAAAEYFALREQAWRRRSEALRTSSLRKLQEAEEIERHALDAFDRMRAL